MSRAEPRRWCEWCRVEPIQPGARSDRMTCSDACHKGRQRARAVGFAGDRAAWRRLPTIDRRRYVPMQLPVPATTAADDEPAP